MNRVRMVGARGKHKDNDGKMVLSPYIPLNGRSLAKAGFSQGDKVLIQSEYGLVTVKLIENVEDNQKKVEENVMQDLQMSFTIKTKNFELMQRLQSLCVDLEMSTDAVFEIAVEKFLNDFNEILCLWTCRQALVKRPYIKPKAGDLF